MLGSGQHARRPVLLVLVFGVLIALVGITASAQAILLSTHFSVATLNGVVGSDSATIRSFLNADNVTVADLQGAGPDATGRARLERQLGRLVSEREILRVDLALPDRSILASSDPSRRGLSPPADARLDAAYAGEPQAAIVAAPALNDASLATRTSNILREDLPVLVGDDIVAVVSIWRDAQPILDRLSAVRRDVVVVTLAAAVVATFVLYLVFRSAQARLTRQTAALLESTRRDALTGLLNHGALVSYLAGEVEQARATGGVLGVALVDVDGFRLLNDTHGHDAGDEALLAVVDLLRRDLPPSIVIGRYGPDEFLLVAPPTAVAELEPAVERLRAGLEALSLRFESTERLPVTVSAALCSYPDHGSSVTAILAVVAQMIEEAKASGGNAIRVAGADDADERPLPTFDVLQGLVLAVDTKDRYTKRHSEDVAKYAVFLAERLDLDPDFIRSIRLAGLLHDVGKIGIPDHVLRKPGKLTAAEYEIVKQHVALGDMIVRDLPDLDVVRAGIRHHHERWDGQGYLHRLAGEEIPLIGRILAVGDAFSAMTTSRPYRKALDVQEALTRLGDAAGTQLDERLVSAFVDGIESAPNPPLPHSEPATPVHWAAGSVA